MQEQEVDKSQCYAVRQFDSLASYMSQQYKLTLRAEPMLACLLQGGTASHGDRVLSKPQTIRWRHLAALRNKKKRWPGLHHAEM
eukprot:5821-Heterococcus_DN1.PRE.1